MNRLIKLILAAAAIAGYYLILRYAAPSHDPYFVLGIGVIGLVAWLHGMAAGLMAALLLAPLTNYVYSQFDVAFSYTTFAYSPAYIVLQILAAVSLGRLGRTAALLARKEKALLEANETLQSTLSQVREMGGIHSLCTSCKSIQDDDGSWTKIDTYLKQKTKAEFSHGICPECARQYEVPSAPKPGQALDR
jgi:hypothetical protein